MTLRLAKHHGLGNDFLVTLTDVAPTDPTGLAARLCDRRTGIGADGLVVGTPGGAGADLTMALHNADGSRAEMSGNGIRCLAHAETRRRGAGTVALRIGTDAGLRAVSVEPGPDPATIIGVVDMGSAKLVPGSTPPGPAEVDLGNPHLVYLAGGEAPPDLARLGAAHPDVNVEVITPAGPDRLELKVWERGVGPTLACGTGACAAVYAAHAWGLVGDRVVVSMPGGEAEVTLADTITLRGPSVHIADLEVDL